MIIKKLKATSKLIRAGRPVSLTGSKTGFLLNRFNFQTGLSEPVSFLNRFVGTGSVFEPVY
jgi:hypothetical protein